LRDALDLLKLLLIECNIVILRYVLQGLQQIVFHVFFALLLFDDDRALEVQVVFFLEDIEKRRVGAAIDADLLEFVAEVVLNWLFAEGVSCHNNVVLAL
jgi:hypothetical protein